MQTPTQPRNALALIAALCGLAVAAGAPAQDSNPFIEEVIVTATKRAGGVDVQDAGLAITAFSATQIDEMFLRDVKAIGYSAPSVQLEDIGTTRGTANFSIRGLGVNSSIPSIEPTVGTFVDGVYLGINAGVVFDVFDLEGIEVLRGPQGLLFGRNVTGGAVLLRTTRPADQLSLNTRIAYETGDNSYLSAVLSGPFSDSLGGKAAFYYNNDDGWFTNNANGAQFGKAETKMGRLALEWAPTDTFDAILRYETFRSDGDGPAAQNAGVWGTTDFNFAIDEPGFYDAKSDMVNFEIAWDVGGGDGQIVNILAWREYEATTNGDIDALPVFGFHAPSSINQDQISNELRYAGSIGDNYLTTGIFYFTQDISYRENRQIPSVPLDITGGGDQSQDTIGLFAQFDWTLTDDVTLNLGARYTQEEKDGRTSKILFDLCEISGGCLAYDFMEKRTWSSIAPKIGVQVTPNEDGQLYMFWTQGFRSGGFNFRDTAVAVPNESFDQEEQNSVEIGWKQTWGGGTVRTNFAGYHNTIKDLQREINESDPIVGVVQLIRNTADATIVGFDAEVDWALSDTLFLAMSLGYVDGNYDVVRFDLNGDGVIDADDENLALPRLAPWSYGAQLTYTREFSAGTFSAQVSGYHRDSAAYTDNNLGQLRAADMFDASLGFLFWDEQMRLSIFGRNLKNESTIGGDTQTPFLGPGGGSTFSPLNKGRTYGIELHYIMQ